MWVLPTVTVTVSGPSGAAGRPRLPDLPVLPAARAVLPRAGRRRDDGLGVAGHVEERRDHAQAQSDFRIARDERVADHCAGDGLPDTGVVSCCQLNLTDERLMPPLASASVAETARASPAVGVVSLIVTVPVAGVLLGG